MKLRGKNFIKVPSIIMLVGAGINLLSSLVYLSGALVYWLYAPRALALPAFLIGAAQIAAGVLGLKYANRKDKADICLILGIVLAGVSVLSNILLMVISGGSIATVLLSIVGGLILPALYIIGACLNRNDNGDQVFNAPQSFTQARPVPPAQPVQPMPARPQAAPAAPMYSPGGWTCVCGNPGNTGSFCLRCGKSRPVVPTPPPAPAPMPASVPVSAPAAPAQEQESGSWTCSCGQAGNNNNFCIRCGKPRPVSGEAAPESGWTCACGKRGNEGNFCIQCGGKKPEPGVPEPLAAAPARPTCPKCGWQPEGEASSGRFCLRCGASLEKPQD